MPCCAVPNCSNSAKKGFRLFHFPANDERRKRWVINIRRKEWTPTTASRICEVHFDLDQFEQHRMDGWKKLKPNAIPKICHHVPEKDDSLYVRNGNKRRKLIQPDNDHLSPTSYETSQCIDLRVNGHTDQVADNSDVVMPVTTITCTEHAENSTLETSVKHHDDHQQLTAITTVNQDAESLKEKNNKLQREVYRLRKALQKQVVKNENLQTNCSSVFNEDQLKLLQMGKNRKLTWSSETLFRAFRMRFVLGVRGYKYMRVNGYPLPALCTLNKKLQDLSFAPGMLACLFPYLKEKVQTMLPVERYCAISFDEMEISEMLAYDSNLKTFVGHVSLGDPEKTANRLLMVLVRGLSTQWKQIVAYEATASSTNREDLKKLIFHVIQSLQDLGLIVIAVVSDMNTCNQAFWSAVGVTVNHTTMQTFFTWEDGRQIHVVADVPHLLKNMWLCLQKNTVMLDTSVTEQEGLPSCEISHSHIATLFNLQKQQDMKLLHHLDENDVCPSHFQKMDVGRAVRYFSPKTAAALETAVSLQLLPAEALTTAWYVRFMHQWFVIASSRARMKSITSKNYESKAVLLKSFIKVMQTTTIAKSWKPVQTGTILTTMSLLNLSRDCFDAGFYYLLGSRLSQDALENVFSTIRHKSKAMPNMLECISAIKLVTLSQFLNIKELHSAGSYMKDNDEPLLIIKSYSTTKCDEPLLNVMNPASCSPCRHEKQIPPNFVERLTQAVENTEETSDLPLLVLQIK